MIGRPNAAPAVLGLDAHNLSLPSDLVDADVAADALRDGLSLLAQRGNVRFVTSTTFMNGSESKYIVRAHPDFHDGPWYDWVRASFQSTSGAVQFACRVLAMFTWSSSSPEGRRTTFLFAEKYTARAPWITYHDLRSRVPYIDLPLVMRERNLDDRFVLLEEARILGPLWVTPRVNFADSYWVLVSRVDM